MKTLILFASSHGTTEKVARIIEKKIGEEYSQVINLKKNPGTNLNSFDRIIIGGSIHAGSMQGSVKTFCNKHLEILLQKKVALFMCGLNKPELENEFANAFPSSLRDHASTYKFIGGEYIFDRMNFIEKFLIKKIAGVKESESHLNYEKIDELVDEFALN
jgi:menaquinone-dependent protoporphyrinogen oxidase